MAVGDLTAPDSVEQAESIPLESAPPELAESPQGAQASNPEPPAVVSGNGRAAPGGPASPTRRLDLKPLFASLRQRLSRPEPAATVPSLEGSIPDSAVAPPGPESGVVTSVRDFNPPLTEPEPLPQSSDEIFAGIGRELRARREMLSLTYEEIERHTHVRAAFLEALERGALDELPSPVQTRGILVNYAGFLDLDVDAILLRFADAVQARYREKGVPKPARSKAPLTVNTTLPPLRGFIASDLVFGGGLAIMLLLFAVWGINRVMVVRSETASVVTPPSISEVLAGTAPPTLVQQVTVIPAQDTAVATLGEATATLELATLNPKVKVQVDLTATERTYLRVTVDGKVQFQGRTDIGSSYSYEAASQVEVLVGNASAVRVVYNSQDLGLMGNFGQVVDRLYTESGVSTPTATPAPTNTPTPKVTATPTQTLTLTPSPTRTP